MWKMNPLRCVRGAAALTDASNNSTFGLFNNSTGAHVLLVWKVTGTTEAGILTKVIQGRLTNHDQGVVSPVVTGEGTQPGALDTDDLVLMTDPDFLFGPFVTDGPQWPSGSPLAILRPGMTLVWQPISQTGAAFGGVFWEWRYAEELWRESAGDSADD